MPRTIRPRRLGCEVCRKGGVRRTDRLVGKGLSALLIAALQTLSPPAPASDAEVENRIRAAILYNIALFVTWPPHSFVDAQSPLQFCIVQSEEMAAEMERGLKQRSINGRAVQVLPLTDAGANLRHCHLAYFGKRDSIRIPSALRDLSGLPILTVHESERAARDGVVRLLRDDHKLRFEINHVAASRNHLMINSRLLKLAIVVDEW